MSDDIPSKLDRPLQVEDRAAHRVERTLFAWCLAAALALLALLAQPALTSLRLVGQQSDGSATASASVPWLPLVAYPAILAGTWFFLFRCLGRRDAAMLGSLAFTFSTFNLPQLVRADAVAAVAHMPWLLGLIDVVMVEGRRWKVAAAQAALTLLTVTLVLVGGVQYAWFALLAETCYVAYLMVARRYVPRAGCAALATCTQCAGCRRSTPERVALAKALGLALGIVALPAALGTLGLGTPSPSDEGLHPINLVQIVAPYLPSERVLGGSPVDWSLYVGAVPLMLAVWVMARADELGRLRPLARGVALFAATALVLAVGDFGPVRTLQSWAPALGWLPFSGRYAVLFQFAVAMLAAMGFALLEREGRHTRRQPRLAIPARAGSLSELWRQFEPLWAVVFASVAVAVAGLILQGKPGVASLMHIVTGPLLLAVAALLLIAAAKGVRGALVALVLFAAADLGHYDLSWTRTGEEVVGGSWPVASESLSGKSQEHPTAFANAPLAARASQRLASHQLPAASH